MTQTQFENEAAYQMTMQPLKRLFTLGIITESEYQKADNIMLEKYSPVIGKLFAKSA